MNSYSPFRSTVTDETLVKFLRSDLEFDIETVPGIGPKAKEALAAKGVNNTFQLIAVFLKFKEEQGEDCVAHCTKFFNFLDEAGVKGNRHSVTKSIAEKVAIFLPNLYVEAQFANLEPMDSSV